MCHKRKGYSKYLYLLYLFLVAFMFVFSVVEIPMCVDGFGWFCNMWFVKFTMFGVHLFVLTCVYLQIMVHEFLKNQVVNS